VAVKIINRSKLWLGISAIVILLSIGGLIFKGLNLGIDFTGGNLFQVKFEKEVNLDELNTKLDSIAEKEDQFNKTSRIVQETGVNEYFIRTSELTEDQKISALSTLKELGNYELLKSEKVGAAIGKELTINGLYALLLGSLLIVLYITFRFEFKFALAAIIALFHDIIISIGVIALLGYEVNTPFIAAVLTILGYSINDTIVVFDRIREMYRKHKEASLGEIIDESINSVMKRSINTSFTTFLAVAAILFLGGASLKTFMSTLLIGVIAGTYSSIFVASPVVYVLEKKQGLKNLK
jgi:preprotein translocase subunit SecF